MRRDQFSAFVVGTFFVAAIVIFSLINRNFLTGRNIHSVLLTAVPMSLMAIGQCCCYMAGYFDLSVGMVGGMGGIAAAWMMGRTENVLLSIVFGILVGIVCGLCAGFLVSVLGMNSFITTFALQNAYRGILFMLTEGFPISMTKNLYKPFTIIGQGKLFDKIQYPILIMITLYILMFLFMRYRRFGRSIALVGANAKCAHISGISLHKIQVGIFVLSGVMAACGGMLNSMRLASAQPFMGETLTMESIASMIVGGTYAGVGNLAQVFVGVMTIYVVKNGLIMAGLPDFYQYIAIGLILYTALLLQADRRSTR